MKKLKLNPSNKGWTDVTNKPEPKVDLESTDVFVFKVTAKLHKPLSDEEWHDWMHHLHNVVGDAWERLPGDGGWIRIDFKE
jgi:hypothetical protein